ncbi:MAG: polyamine ABC transporter ATP-binding protein [Robiginitomaculum sp.]|nr:MAG: polyamine ABC transporter ATP-binding protein [Robiginitomaculum sp.]
MSETQTNIAARPWADKDATPFIRIKNVTKKFGEFVAVENVSLDIYRGELFCLLGGSGSGKSTLLRMMSGFETLTSGSIEIDGQDMAGVAPYDRQTNMMFQSYALFPHMSVEKNIAYGLKRERIAKAEIKQRVEEIISMVQLDQFATRMPHQLSGGQRQRVALARALVKKPKLLLLDEPMGALDKKLREETQFELINIQESLGVTFVVVTHDQEEAMTLSTRIGVMTDGEIVQVGEPREIYEYPRSRFVADFIGSVNMFEGQVKEDADDHVIISSPDAGADIYVAHGVSCTLGQKIAVAVRPEKIQLSKARPNNARNILKGKVDEIAYLGNLSVYQLLLETGKRVRVTQSNLSRVGDDAITYEDEVFMSWSGGAGVVLQS